MATTTATITAASQPFSNLFTTPTVNASDVMSSKDENSEETTSFLSGEWFKTQKDPLLPSLVTYRLHTSAIQHNPDNIINTRINVILLLSQSL